MSSSQKREFKEACDAFCSTTTYSQEQYNEACTKLHNIDQCHEAFNRRFSQEFSSSFYDNIKDDYLAKNNAYIRGNISDKKEYLDKLIAIQNRAKELKSYDANGTKEQYMENNLIQARHVYSNALNALRRLDQIAPLPPPPAASSTSSSSSSSVTVGNASLSQANFEAFEACLENIRESRPDNFINQTIVRIDNVNYDLNGCGQNLEKCEVALYNSVLADFYRLKSLVKKAGNSPDNEALAVTEGIKCMQRIREAKDKTELLYNTYSPGQKGRALISANRHYEDAIKLISYIGVNI